MAFMTFRPLPPKGHCHHHRPVISFKEQLLVNRELLAVSSALTAIPKLALQTALNFSKLLTAYRSPVTPKSPVSQSRLRLPRYKDPRAGAAGSGPVPKLPGNSNNRGPRHRRRLVHSCAAMDAPKLFPA